MIYNVNTVFKGADHEKENKSGYKYNNSCPDRPVYCFRIIQIPALSKIPGPVCHAVCPLVHRPSDQRISYAGIIDRMPDFKSLAYGTDQTSEKNLTDSGNYLFILNIYRRRIRPDQSRTGKCRLCSGTGDLGDPLF